MGSRYQDRPRDGEMCPELYHELLVTILFSLNSKSRNIKLNARARARWCLTINYEQTLISGAAVYKKTQVVTLVTCAPYDLVCISISYQDQDLTTEIYSRPPAVDPSSSWSGGPVHGGSHRHQQSEIANTPTPHFSTQTQT